MTPPCYPTAGGDATARSSSRDDLARRDPYDAASMSSPWKDYAADAILRDGTSVHVRAIRPDDRAELVRGFAELIPASVFFRFFR